MRCLVLGGTTFFGLEIVRQLLAEGHDVAVFTRGRRALSDDLAGQVEQVEGDRRSPVDLERAARTGPWNAVIDNIAFNATDVENALAAFRGVGRYVLTSSASVYRWASGGIEGRRQPIEEDDVDFARDPIEYEPGDPAWAYAYGKVYAEKAVRGQEDTPWTVIRPPIVLGPNDPTLRGYWYFARLIQGGPLLLSDSGSGSFRLAYSVDLARAYVLALKTERAVGRAYNIAQPEIVTLRQLVRVAATTMGVGADLVDVPSHFLTRDGREFGGPYGWMVNFVLDIERATQELEYQATPFDQWLASTVTWYHGQFNGDPTSVLDTRSAELALAARWREATAPLRG